MAEDTNTPGPAPETQAPPAPDAAATAQVTEKRFDNKAGRRHVGDKAVTAEDKTNQILPGVDGSRERMADSEHRDQVYLDAQDIEEMGLGNAVLSSQAEDPNIPGDRVILGIRDHKMYGRVEADRLRAVRRKYGDVKVGTIEGRAAGHEDIIYVSVPRDVYLQMERDALNAAAHQFTKQVIEGQVEGREGLIKVFQQDEATLRQIKDETHNKLRAEGIVEKRPAGMSYDDVLHFTGAERTRDLEREMARGGRTERPNEYEEYEERRKSSAKNRKYSLPGSPTR